MTLRSILSAICLLFTGTLLAQEIITPLNWNPYLAYHYKDADVNTMPASKRTDPIELPFFDDFSSTRIYPDKARWMDRDVYINSSFCVLPPSHGVATFDGLDQRGFPYNTDGFNDPRPCDTLTSNYIDLSELSEDDSVYLSFYVQQKGLGDNPEPDDSFILEFKTDSKKWINAWAINGQTKNDGNHPFIQYLVKVYHPTFELFHDSFQFRFRNYGNKTGALDHWHLDYVYLNKSRSATDTVIRDVGIYRQPKGLFKNYYSMPYRHFAKSPNTYLNPSIDYNVYNKDSNVQSPDIYYVITDVTNNQQLYSSLSEGNSLPLVGAFSRKSGSQTNKLPQNYFSSLSDPRVRLELKLNVSSANVVSGIELTKENDNFLMYQNFDNYFSYDDGSAEGGYGLQNVREGGVALKFKVEVPETLKYIAFHFTGGFEVLPEQKKFNVMVWDKIHNGEVVRATISGVKPIYSDYINGFVLYALETPLAISGDFYIGWEQYSNFNLNVGIDLNYRFFNKGEPNPNLFFNAKGTWEPSKVIGTPMIRPVFADSVELNIPEINLPGATVYPNPTQDLIRVLWEQDNYNASLFNLQGQLLLSQTRVTGACEFQIADLPNGIYLLRLENGLGKSINRMIIKE